MNQTFHSGNANRPQRKVITVVPFDTKITLWDLRIVWSTSGQRDSIHVILRHHDTIKILQFTVGEVRRNHIEFRRLEFPKIRISPNNSPRGYWSVRIIRLHHRTSLSERRVRWRRSRGPETDTQTKTKYGRFPANWRPVGENRKTQD